MSIPKSNLPILNFFCVSYNDGVISVLEFFSLNFILCILYSRFKKLLWNWFFPSLHTYFIFYWSAFTSCLKKLKYEKKKNMYEEIMIYQIYLHIFIMNRMQREQKSTILLWLWSLRLPLWQHLIKLIGNLFNGSSFG